LTTPDPKKPTPKKTPAKKPPPKKPAAKGPTEKAPAAKSAAAKSAASKESPAKSSTPEKSAPEKPALKQPKDLDTKTVRIVLAALLGVAILVVLGIAIFGGGDGSCTTTVPRNGKPVLLSEQELTCNAGDLGHPAYWVGPRPGTTAYEVTDSSDGRIFIRYLTGDAKAGDKRADFITVGTYALPNAVKALKTAQAQDNSRTLSQEDGFTLLDGGESSNAYVVFDDQPGLQIEVYSPNPGEASGLAASALEPLE